MKLSINSTSNTQLVLKLDDKEKIVVHASPRDQDLLASIDQFLHSENKTLHDLTEIEVATGPGKFTSLRVGIAVAQALSYALQIPLNGQSAGTVIEPQYGAEPNITKSNKLF